jgi:MarR family transcriptional regulator, organic hydroperoxide resistance regulator
VDPLFEFALLLKANQRELERRVNEAMEPLGITAAQADALVVIGQVEPLSLKDLGDLLIAEAGHPSRLVERLVEAGLVRRSVAAEDRRRVDLSLTPKGQALAAEVDAARAAVSQLAGALIGDRDLSSTLNLLRELSQYTPYAGLLQRRRELL